MTNAQVRALMVTLLHVGQELAVAIGTTGAIQPQVQLENIAYSLLSDEDEE